MRIITLLMWLCFMTVTTYAQDDQNNQEKGTVIEMDDLMFRYRIFDYKNESNEWKYKGDKPCIVDFYATWCAPCRMIAPTLKELAQEYNDSIYVYKVDVDKQKELSRAMGIQSMPTVLFIPMEGQPQAIIGAADKNTFHRAVNEVLLNK